MAIKAKFAGKQKMITFQELARAYPNQLMPMMVVEDIRPKALRSTKALLIGIDELPLAIEEDSGAAPTPEQMAAGEEMLDLEDVIRVSNAAGRSSVHAMEASNRLFGVLPPGRIRGKRYPKWQFEPGIAGEPLRRILTKLENVDSWARYQFFASVFPELGHLTPVEVLAGVQRSGAKSDETIALLQSPHDKRIRLIEELAVGFSHSS